ncbi:DUF2723 domain-containing protein [Myxococcota bacterium]|nr:DUF2723 domain-containing protein [Myxococcota bacterium]
MARHPLSPAFDAPPDPRAGPIALAVLTAVAVFLVGGVLPSAAFFDTGEFGAVAWRLGISHPPGHPAHAAVTGAILRLPLGDVPFRANLASALCLATALGAFALLLRALAPRLSVIGIVAAAALPAVMPAIWLQGVRAEVYALQLLLSVGLAGLCLAVARGRDARALPALALTFGLAGANHSLLGLALVPAALLAIALGRPGRRALLAAVPAGALGLSAYLWLPLRATGGGEVGWGRPDTLADFWAVLSAKDWQGNLVRTEALDLADNAYQVVDYLMSQIGYAPAGLFFIVLAAGALTGGRRTRGLILACLAVAACVIATRFFYPFDALNPDMGGYFAPALLALVAAVVVAADAFTLRAGVLAMSTLPVVLLFSGGAHDPGQRRGARVAEPLVRGMLDEVPPGGALVMSDYSTLFGAWSLRAAEGYRPDVGLVFRGQAGRGWYIDRLATISPEWALRLADFPAAFARPDVRLEPGVLLDRLGPLAAGLRASGLTLAVDAATGAPDAGEAALARAFDRVLPGDPTRADLDARRTLGALHLSHAEAHLARGPAAPPAARERARWHLTRVEALAPGDPATAALAARLGPPPVPETPDDPPP